MNLLQRHPAPTVTLQLLACLVAVVLPHAMHLQPWILLSFLVMVLWRGAAALKHWPMPSRPVRLLLGLAVIVGVYISYGRINGQQGGVALLVALLGIKLTELGSFRDHIVVALLAYFVLISQFLFSQELVMVLWLVVGSWLITATLLSISHPQFALPFKTSIKRSASLLLQSLPLMLLCFLLFPRIPGPLWGLPADAGAARSGLSDSMSPGDIGHLVSTDDIAFRVQFEGRAPKPSQLYWRGPVFEFFDGRRWKARSATEANVENTHYSALIKGDNIRYEITLEPHRQRWMFVLDVPDRIPADASIGRNGLVLASEKIIDRKLYSAESALSYRLEPALGPVDRNRNLGLPSIGNPQTRDYAAELLDRGLSKEEIVEHALSMFREKHYVYSLQPPTLGRNAVDEFLFETKRGFCEHYAGSFAFLMRSAGIPTRIVTGYQGGEYNELGGYYILRQSDAHAWNEVWLEDRGWVRIDPTGAVAPDRIEYGIDAALPVGEAMAAAIARRRGEGLLRNLRMRWDWVNNSWYRWVLGYGPELQADFLGKFGLKGWGHMILALTVLATLFLSILGLILIWRLGRKPKPDHVQRIWQDFSQKLQRYGLQRLPYEGPVDYSARISKKLPQQITEIGRISQLYMTLRYGDNKPTDSDMTELCQAVRRFKPQRPLAQ